MGDNRNGVNLTAKKQELLKKMIKGKVNKEKANSIARVKQENEIPLSFAQQRLWFLEQLVPNSPLYNMPNALHLKGELDFQALENSLIEIVKRHKVLSTSFKTLDNQPVQYIDPNVNFSISKIDFQHISNDEERMEKVEASLMEESRKPFNLEEPPLMRAKLFILGNNEYVLSIVMHHIISDGWSLGVLVKELTALYENFKEGLQSPLKPLSIQYADFAVWQRNQLNSNEMKKQLDYWREKLSGELPMLQLPVDKNKYTLTEHKGNRFKFYLEKSLVENLKRLAKREEATMYMTLLALYNTLLYRYTGQEDLIVGSPIAGRNRSEIEPLVGCFANTLPLRVDVSGEPSFRELLHRVKK